MDDKIRIPDIRLPKIQNPLMSRERLNPAAWMYERLVKQIVDFESRLSPDEEIGGRFVAAPKEGAFHIENISYWGPDLLMFVGRGCRWTADPTDATLHPDERLAVLRSEGKRRAAPNRVHSHGPVGKEKERNTLS
jgi:hypothetical protein